jgi:hypothetical protein
MHRASLLLAASLLSLMLAPAAFSETRTYDFKDFKKLSVSALYEVEFVQAPTYSITIDSKTNRFDDILVEKKGDMLMIGRPDHGWNDNRRNREDVRDVVRISAPNLNELDLHAAVNFRARAMKTDKLDLNLHAAVDLDIAGIDAKTIVIESHAGVQAKLSGTCGDLSLATHTGADVDAHDLKCSTVSVEAHTGADASVFASQSVKASARMGSTIRVAGHPKSVQKEISKTGDIQIAD